MRISRTGVDEFQTLASTAAQAIGTSEDTIDQKIGALATIIATTVKYRGALSNGTDFNTLAGKEWGGLWEVNGATAAVSMVNAPDTGGFSYTLQIIPQANGATSHIVISYATGFGVWVRATANLAGTFWLAWDKLATTRDLSTWDKGQVPRGTDFNTLRIPGACHVNTQADADTMRNMPISSPCNIEILASSNGIVAQRVTPYSANQAIWFRTTGSVGNGTFMPWWNITDPKPAAPNMEPIRRTIFQESKG